MIKLLSVAILAGFCFASNRAFVPPDDEGPLCFTGWFNNDNPGGTGDWERMSDLRKEHPGQICNYPWQFEAVTADTNTPASETGDVIYFNNAWQGFACRNQDQNSGMCRDYKIRFACPCSK